MLTADWLTFSGRVSRCLFSLSLIWVWVWVLCYDRRSVGSLSWYKAPIRGLWPDFYFRPEYGIRLTVTFLIPWGALSDEKTGLFFECAAGPCQRSLSRVLVPWACDRTLLSQIWDFPFRRLLRLAGSRWRYSTPPPHGFDLLGSCLLSVSVAP
jgi:hypothetical protein